MYIDKNFSIDPSLKKQLLDKGFFVIKNYFKPKLLREINKKVNKLILNYENFLPPRNIKFYKKKLKNLKQPNGTLKEILDNKKLKKGHKYFKNYTNSVSYKKPLIKLKSLNKLVFDKKLTYLMRYLFNKDVKLGPIKVASFFNNNLPINCINYFHSDHLTSNGKKMPKCLKISISLNANNIIGGEYMHIAKRVNKLKFNKQYFEKKFMTDDLKNNLVTPKLSLGDIIVFDPSNFYHAATKPERTRNMLYLEYISLKNKNKTYPNYIDKLDYKKLSNLQKLLAIDFIKI